MEKKLKKRYIYVVPMNQKNQRLVKAIFDVRTKFKDSLIRNYTMFLNADKDSYNNPIQYTSNPLLSSYISKENKNTVPFKVQRFGRGSVIVFTDNTNFRAFWFGTNKLLMNTVFFGDKM